MEKKRKKRVTQPETTHRCCTKKEICASGHLRRNGIFVFLEVDEVNGSRCYVEKHNNF